MIYLLTQTTTPLFSSIADEDATARVTRWQTDEIRAPSTTNRHAEGDDTATPARTPTSEFANVLQIFKGAARVSRTQNKVAKAGRSNEMSYQVEKEAIALKRDIEATFLSNNPGQMITETGNMIEKSPFSGTEASGGRGLAGLLPWMRTIKLNYAADGSTGTGFASAPVTISATVGYPILALDVTGTDADQFLGLNENAWIDLMQEIYDKGGAPDMVLLTSKLKTKFSRFKGANQKEIQASEGEIYHTLDVYHTDFGPVEIYPCVDPFNRWIEDSALGATDKDNTRSSYLFCLEKDKLAAGWFDDFELTPLAKTGDSEAKQLTAELTLINRAPNAHGLLFGIAPTKAPVVIT